eukprot:3568836-Pyramimonas_sp.AAC.2
MRFPPTRMWSISSSAAVTAVSLVRSTKLQIVFCLPLYPMQKNPVACRGGVRFSDTMLHKHESNANHGAAVSRGFDNQLIGSRRHFAKRYPLSMHSSLNASQIPCFSALIGYITNVIALWMTFYPIGTSQLPTTGLLLSARLLAIMAGRASFPARYASSYHNT